MQGNVDNENRLEEDDFLIVIQSDVQKDIAKRFVAKGLCCDSIHGTTTGYDFVLNTLLAVDEFGEVFPIAWCLSNHEGYKFMEIFFRKIKENCGILDPSWVMSDLALQYYTAFAVVNDCSPKRLLCTWHVDKAWKEELNKKVSDVAVQADVYKMLRVLLEERSQTEFEDKLKIFIDRINQGGTQMASFLAYFQSYWLKRC